MTAQPSTANLTQRRLRWARSFSARCGLWGLLFGPLLAVLLVVGAMVFDPKCGVGDSGGCAMGIVTAPLAIALPSFALFFGCGLLRGLWQRQPADWGAAIRRLRTMGRED